MKNKLMNDLVLSELSLVLICLHIFVPVELEEHSLKGANLVEQMLNSLTIVGKEEEIVSRVVACSWDHRSDD